MWIPVLAQRVRVRGRGDLVFFVASVDEEREAVSLIPVVGISPCLEAVPFNELSKAQLRVRDSSDS